MRCFFRGKRSHLRRDCAARKKGQALTGGDKRNDGECKSQRCSLHMTPNHSEKPAVSCDGTAEPTRKRTLRSSHRHRGTVSGHLVRHPGRRARTISVTISQKRRILWPFAPQVDLLPRMRAAGSPVPSEGQRRRDREAVPHSERRARRETGASAPS